MPTKTKTKPKVIKKVTTTNMKGETEILPVMEIDDIKEHMRQQSAARSETPTPKNVIKRKGDGFDYVDEAYMRNQLTKHFPDWSWIGQGTNPVQFLGSEWVIVSGELVINDNGHQRRFFSPGGARIQYNRGKEHTAENVVDIDKNVASANAYAFKRAVNRLGRIADDVYKKTDTEVTQEQKDQLKAFHKKHPLSKDMLRIIKTKQDNGTINKQNFQDLMEELHDNIKETK